MWLNKKIDLLTTPQCSIEIKSITNDNRQKLFLHLFLKIY